jgi:hypothetical protein
LNAEGEEFLMAETRESTDSRKRMHPRPDYDLEGWKDSTWLWDK